MRGTLMAVIVGMTALGAAAGCSPRTDAVSALEPAAGSDQVVAAATSATPEPAQSILVSDEAPRELVFTSSLNARQRSLIGSELEWELANARGPATATVAEADLNADGSTELFVIIRSDGWCGSGDVCNLWIYEQAGEGWRALSDGNDAASCVSILPSATNGYRDVRIHGQCALDMCSFDLRFDGTVYAWDGNRDCRPTTGG